MSTIKVEDICIWPSHIEGNDLLTERLLSMSDGAVVILKIGGTSGAFRKMIQGKNRTPTPGFKPACDTTRVWWGAIFAANKGSRLPIMEVLE